MRFYRDSGQLGVNILLILKVELQTTLYHRGDYHFRKEACLHCLPICLLRLFDLPPDLEHKHKRPPTLYRESTCISHNLRNFPI